MPKEKTKKIKIPSWLLWTAIIFFIFVSFFISAYLTFEKKYINRIYPRVYAGEINLGGKTLEEAKKIIDDKIILLYQNGITFYHGSDQMTLFPIISSLEGDIAYQIVNFDTEKTFNKAASFGRSENFTANSEDKMKALFKNHKIALTVTLNEDEIEKILKQRFADSEIPPQDAELTYKKIGSLAGSEIIEFQINQEKTGRTINYQGGIFELKHRLADFNTKPIELYSSTAYPRIYKKDCLNIESKAQNILTLAPLTLKYQENEWKIEKEQLADWLSLKINPQYNEETSQDEEKVIVGINNKSVQQFLKNEVAVKINQEPLDAKLEIKEGRVTEFQASRDGIEVDIKENLVKVEAELIEKRNNQIDLIVKELKSAVSVGNINDLGIEEIIGIGESNFAGSPKNRRHNIKVGADTLNGILIKPAEEFSTLKALGKIDSSAGYLPELVIKDNKTIPEFGGGLCQIGTTMFRVVLASGLPITMRRNHSYRVPYYEPAGVDATIYDPWPDFKFINDTNSYILVQTRIEGDNLYFDFWGTKDGRLVEKAKPTIYNIVKPGPTKLIETLDLKPGEKKCTERAHNGADAYFDYKVTYPNEEVKEKRFTSHYVPWQEVCLIGVEKLSDTQEEEIKDEEQINKAQ